MANLFIGTSGFSHKNWIGKFYPEELPSRGWLEYYAEHFSTVEINNTFYRIPSKKTFQNWYKRTPENFVFSIKTHQGVTHLKKLIFPNQYWENFISSAKLLKEKLGPILLQLPENFYRHRDRLEIFLKKYKQDNLKFAFEFRHESWFDQEVYDLLKKYNSALVFYRREEGFASPRIITADFIYWRFHGVKVEYRAELFQDYLNKGLDVYAYYNNTNAQKLKNLLL